MNNCVHFFRNNENDKKNVFNISNKNESSLGNILLSLHHKYDCFNNLTSY